MAKKIQVQLEVKDDGSVKLKEFTTQAKTQLKEVESAGTKTSESLSTGFLSLSNVLKGVVATGGFVALTSFFKDSYKEATEWETRMIRTQNLIKATGNAAGLSAKELGDLAKEVDLNTLGDKLNVIDSINALQTFKSVSGETFKETIRLSADLSATFGTDLRGQVVQLGKALEDPIEGLGALKRVGVSFTESEKELIKTLVESGDKLKAQEQILKAIRGQVGGAAQGDGLAWQIDTLSYEWGEFKEAFADTDSLKGTVKFLADSLHDITESIRQGKEFFKEYNAELASAQRNNIKLPDEILWDGTEPIESVRARQKQYIDGELAKRNQIYSPYTPAQAAASRNNTSLLLVEQLKRQQAEKDELARMAKEKAAAAAKEAAKVSQAKDDGNPYIFDPVNVQADIQKAVEAEKLRNAKLHVEEVKASEERNEFLAQQNNALNELYAKQDAERLAAMQEQYQKEKQLVEDFFVNPMSDAFMDVVKGTKDVSTAFSDMAESILNDMMQMFVRQQMLNLIGYGSSTGTSSGTGIMGMLSSFFFADGGVFTNSIVSRPTLFPMARGMGLMGEAGPEAVMPLTRTSSGKLGVRSDGGGTGAVNVTVNLKNESGANLGVTKQETSTGQNPQEIIVTLWMDALHTNKFGLRNALGG